MALFNVRNFARGEVSQGYNSSATSIDLVTGDGSKMPGTPFYFVWWNATDFPNPVDDPDSEICRCQTRTGDTLTIVRAVEESTTRPASDKNIAGKTYLVENILTAYQMNSLLQILSDGLNWEGSAATAAPGRKLVISSTQDAPPVGPTVALAGESAGNCDNGAHKFKIGYQTNEGRTEGSPLEAGGTVTVADKTVNGKIRVTIPQESPMPVHVENIIVYMTTAGTDNYFEVPGNGEVAVGVTEIVVNASDASLSGSTAMPTSNTTANPLFSAGGAVEADDPSNSKVKTVVHRVEVGNLAGCYILFVNTAAGKSMKFTAPEVTIGDSDGVFGNNTRITVNDAAPSAGIQSTGLTNLGDGEGAVNFTRIEIDDPNQRIKMSGATILESIPSSDPAVAGQLYYDAGTGTVKRSAG